MNYELLSILSAKSAKYLTTTLLLVALNFTTAGLVKSTLNCLTVKYFPVSISDFRSAYVSGCRRGSRLKH